MSERELPRGVIEVAEGFWNIRGSFKVGGLIELGTQCSLVRRASGKYLLLDAIALSEPVARWLDERTDGGAAIEAVLHLHPFHTLHVRGLHERYPRATLYGTARHAQRASDLPWASLRTDAPALHALFADDLDFMVPRGVDFISSDENVHFASVLAIHRASKTLHVDDTLIYARLPFVLRFMGPDTTRFHPTLAKVLERRAGAAKDFRAWARELVERARDVENLCAAHTHALLARHDTGAPIATRIEQALAKVEPVLAAHERKHG